MLAFKVIFLLPTLGLQMVTVVPGLNKKVLVCDMFMYDDSSHGFIIVA